MAKSDLKFRAHRLRRQGSSIKEIVKELGVAKSTVASWCREINLSDDQKEFLYQKMITGVHRGRLRGAAVNRQKKLDAQEKARVYAGGRINAISEHDKLIAGVALYWAEGSKAPSTFGFLFVNSDPVMIRFMYEWLTIIMSVPKEEIYVMVSINELHRYRIDKVLNYWSNLLNLPRSQFAKTSFIKSIQKKRYENQDKHFGVLRLGVKKSSFLKYQTLALIDKLKAEVAQVVGAVVS